MSAREPGVWPLVDAATMRALDRHAIEDLGVSGEILMESAGRAVADVVLECAAGGPVCVVAGVGNNGGDGFVLARHLSVLGVPVRVALVGKPEAIRGDAALHWRRLQDQGVPVDADLEGFGARGVVVDALFGTGLSRPVEGAAAQAIARMNARPEGLIAVAIDLPSGLDADTGQVLGVAVQADVTVTIGLPKQGLALEPGRSHAGRIQVARIGIPDRAPDHAPRAALWTAAA
ncbi:MAG: NAD(P)H-hydrate epimerase, partial [Proteobacteria bacterium]|nr:NAD(P)H-hydrate epimerase [Pseudomonadota bacterium]